MLAAANAQALWYLTRGTGLVALVLLTASVVLGIMETSEWSGPHWPRFLTAGLHRNISLLATAFLAVHIATAVLDGFAPIGWLDGVVPFLAGYRPLWLGLGTVAFDLMVALVITSLVRRHLGYPAWRAIHWLSYACWPLALVHGLGTGSDTSLGWVLVLSLGCLAVAALAVWWRLWKTRSATPAHPGARAVAVVASVVVPLAVVVWLFAGPLQPGWAVRAGTPRSDLTATSSGGG